MLLGHEKESFLHLPTPIEFLPRISNDLGINFYMKRDDLTNIGMGGNKLRKLEYFVYDAKKKGATMIITVGGAQTNHGRLTAAVCAKFNLKCAIVAIDEYPGELSANLLLDEIMGCPVYLVANDNMHTVDEQFEIAAKKVISEYEAKGEKVYYIPMGGSNELGILGYYECSMEITAQAKRMSISDARIITTVGSMGTYMGLAVGLKNEKSSLSLTGIAISPKEGGEVKYAEEYYERVKKFFNLKLNFEANEFDITSDYDCGGYNNPVKEVRDAIYYMGSKEGIILDP